MTLVRAYAAAKSAQDVAGALAVCHDDVVPSGRARRTARALRRPPRRDAGAARDLGGGMSATTRTVYRGCTLCEATCGLRFEVEGDRIVSVRGDEDDVFSHGYVCPKGVAIADVHHDPDRLRTPVRRTAGRPVRADRLGRGVRPRRRAARRDPRARTAPTRSPSTWAIRSSTTTARAGARRLPEGDRHAQLHQRRLAGHQPALRHLVLSVRQLARDPDPRHRPHRLLPLHRRQPGGLERQLHDGARRARAGCAPSASAAAGSWSSIRAAPRRRARPTSTSRSAPAATPRCCWRWCSAGRATVASTRRGSRAVADGWRATSSAARRLHARARRGVTGVPAATIRRLAREFADARVRRRLLAHRRLQQPLRHARAPGPPTC